MYGTVARAVRGQRQHGRMRQDPAPMVVGLLEGLGERFSVDIKIEHEAFVDRDEFRLDVGEVSRT